MTALQTYIRKNVLDKFQGEVRKDFLKNLKNNEPVVFQWVRTNLIDWGTMAIATSGEIIASYDNDVESQQIVAWFKEVFAEELK